MTCVGAARKWMFPFDTRSHCYCLRCMCIFGDISLTFCQGVYISIHVCIYNVCTYACMTYSICVLCCYSMLKHKLFIKNVYKHLHLSDCMYWYVRVCMKVLICAFVLYGWLFCFFFVCKSLQFYVLPCTLVHCMSLC